MHCKGWSTLLWKNMYIDPPILVVVYGLWVVFSLKNQPPNMSWINYLYVLVLRFTSLLGFVQEPTYNYPYNLFMR